MKRYLITFIALLFSSISFAQITRSIWGLKLGESTLKEVKSVVREKGFKLKKESEGLYSVESKKLTFGGANWYYLLFKFYDNKLVSCQFLGDDNHDLSLIYTHEKLKKSLHTKYADYLNSSGNHNNQNIDMYNDNDTMIFLIYGAIRNHNTLSLIYADKDLWFSTEKPDTDEL